MRVEKKILAGVVHVSQLPFADTCPSASYKDAQRTLGMHTSIIIGFHKHGGLGGQHSHIPRSISPYIFLAT